MRPSIQGRHLTHEALLLQEANCDIGAQCGAHGLLGSQDSSSETQESNQLPVKRTISQNRVYQSKIYPNPPVTSILKPAKPRHVSFKEGSYTKIYYSFEPVSSLNVPYQRPQWFYYPPSVRENPPRVEPITVPYSTGPFGVRNYRYRPSFPGKVCAKGRAQVLKDKMEEIGKGKPVGVVRPRKNQDIPRKSSFRCYRQ